MAHARDTLLFHVDLGVPECADPEPGHLLGYTVHAHKEACKDGAANMLPVRLPPYELVEVETQRDGRTVVSWTVRTQLDRTRVLVLVVTADYTVRTVWVNRTDDRHDTLNVHKYARPSRMLATV